MTEPVTHVPPPSAVVSGRRVDAAADAYAVPVRMTRITWEWAGMAVRLAFRGPGAIRVVSVA